MTHEEGLRILGDCRDRIDELDRRILELINQRTRVVEQIGQIKQELRMPIYEPRREDEVFQNVTENNRGPLPTEAVRRVFERIIDEMRTVQKIRMEQRAAAEAARPEE
ncbi:MAG: chorismate mutase [Bryobacterales bacterium]|nr:chorismate mutase [Bryobacterales bacterium]